MNAWLRHSPYLAVGIYISGRLPGLPRPAQPHADLGQHPARATAGGCCRSRSARRRSCNPRFPRYGNDPVISTDPGNARPLRQGPHAGHGRGRQDGRRRQGARASRRAARCGTTSRASTPTNTRCRESALAFLSAWTRELHALRLRLRRLLQRRLGHQDARRGTGRTTPARLPPARPDLDRPLGRPGEHVHVVHPQRRLAPGRPDEAVPRRPQRDVGRGHDQHRPRLPRPRHSPPRRRTETHCGGVHVDFTDYPRRQRRAPNPPAGEGAAVPAHGAEGVRRQGQRQRSTRPRSPRCSAWQKAHGLPVRTVWTRRAWMSLLATGTAAGAEVRLDRAGGPPTCSAPSTPRPRGTDLAVTGIFDQQTDAALALWQNGVAAHGVSASRTPAPGPALAERQPALPVGAPVSERVARPARRRSRARRCRHR